MRVAVVQMVSNDVVSTNLNQAMALLQSAADLGAELAVLPEYFCYIGPRDTDKLAIQEPFGQGPLQRFLADTARRLGLWIVGGTLPLSGHPCESTPAKVFNSCLVFCARGECRARYDKIHLFRFNDGEASYDESSCQVSGTQPVTFDLPSVDGHLWRIGLSVCYDLRFPELYRCHADMGAHLLLVPSAFTHTTGKDHWNVLLRARAIENLAFVAAAAQGGMHRGGRRTWGHSTIINPWGNVLAVRAKLAGLSVADLDIQELLRLRERLPALGHRVLCFNPHP